MVCLWCNSVAINVVQIRVDADELSAVKMQGQYLRTWIIMKSDDDECPMTSSVRAEHGAEAEQYHNDHD